MKRARVFLAGFFLALSLAGCAGLCGRGDCCEDSEHRAGYPSEVSRCARPSDTGRYDGYYVGGGSPCCSAAPTPEQGTWGWDYAGLWWPARVALGWSNYREQGGTGAYRTDGPRPLEHLENGE
jgi:hypothetical protein